MENLSGGMCKFFGEQDARHGGKLFWPGARGLPYRGKVSPLLKRHELESLPIVGDTYERVFDLSNEEDAAYYNWIRSHARNGLFSIDFIERHWDEDSATMRVYIEWTQFYTESPPGGLGDANGDADKKFTLG